LSSSNRVHKFMHKYYKVMPMYGVWVNTRILSISLEQLIFEGICSWKLRVEFLYIY
jgi:hypothetical protein